MKKILFIIESIFLGGTDTFSFNLIDKFKRNSYQVNVLINKEHEGIPLYKKKVNQLFFFKLPTLFTLSRKYKIIYKTLILLFYPLLSIFNILDVLKTLRREKTDTVFVVNGGFPGGFLTYTSMIACGISNIKTIYTIHNYCSYSRKYLIYNFIIEKIASKFNNIKFISVSKDCANNINKNSFLSKYINFIHNGCIDYNEKRYAPTFTDIFNIVWVGNFSENKGVDILLKAYFKLKKKYSFINLYLYGNVVEEDYYIKIKEISSEISGVKIVLNEFDKNKIYKNKHLVVLPSRAFESFGLVLIEGMCFGIPVITVNHLGMKEIVEIDKSIKFGYLFENENIKDLSEKIELVLKNKENYKKLSLNSRYIYEKYFDVDIMFEKYLQLIEN